LPKKKYAILVGKVRFFVSERRYWIHDPKVPKPMLIQALLISLFIQWLSYSYLEQISSNWHVHTWFAHNYQKLYHVKVQIKQTRGPQKKELNRVYVLLHSLLSLQVNYVWKRVRKWSHQCVITAARKTACYKFPSQDGPHQREKRACPARERGERLRVAPNYFSLSSMHAHLKCESIFCDAGEEILIASRQHFIMTRVCVQSQSLFASDAPRAARHVRPRALTWSELGENALDLCMRIHSIRTSTGALRFNGGIARGALWRWRAQWVVKKGWSFKSRFAPWV
jgi:hypothetical protein